MSLGQPAASNLYLKKRRLMFQSVWKRLTGTLIVLVLLVTGIVIWYHRPQPAPPPPIAPAAPPPEKASEAVPDAATEEPTINNTVPTAPQAASPASQQPPPQPLTREQLPDALPDTATLENRHVWVSLVNEAVKDEALMQKLLPDTKERADEIMSHLANSLVSETRATFEGAMWRKMAALYPNDPEVLFMHTRYLPRGPRATRAEKEAFVAAWERLKQLNDEHGIPITSGLRKTHSLSQTYIELGQYEKAIENIHEQNERIAALQRARIHDMRMYHGTLPRGTVIELQKLLDAQRKQQEGTQ